jgi:hypothetical protein
MRAEDMLLNDEAFRAQFDRDSETFHGDLLRDVNTGEKLIPEGMEAHTNWKNLAINDDNDKENDFGEEFRSISELRDRMNGLKKSVQALCMPTDTLVKARAKVAALEITAGGGTDMPSDADLEAAAAGPEYIAAEAFDGARPGFAFGTGEHGQGYYNQGEKLKKAKAAATRAANGAKRKVAQAQKGVVTAQKRLEGTVQSLRVATQCLEGTQFSSGSLNLNSSIERLVAEALDSELTEQKFKERWSVDLKRVTEACFSSHNSLLTRLKEIKRSQGQGHVALVLPSDHPVCAEPEPQPPEAEILEQCKQLAETLAAKLDEPTMFGVLQAVGQLQDPAAQLKSLQDAFAAAEQVAAAGAGAPALAAAADAIAADAISAAEAEATADAAEN